MGILGDFYETLQFGFKYTIIVCHFACFFFSEMVEDWTVNYKADLLTFVPYEWSFNIVLRDFEMVWLGNQHNWIECASNKPNNGVLLFLSKIVLVIMFVVENNTLFQMCY